MLTYGNTELPPVTQQWQELIAKHFTLKDILLFGQGNFENNTNWPDTRFVSRTQIELGTLFWPVGAARFAHAHFLASEVELEKIRVYAKQGSTLNGMKLVMGNPDSPQERIETMMFMLPPLPLFDLHQSNGDKGMWLLSMVDARFFWWYKSSAISVTGGTTTWSTLISSIGTALGVTITPDTIDADYLKPTGAFISNYDFIPLVLDSVCASVGHRVIRKLDGTVITQSASTSLTKQNTQIATKFDAWDKVPEPANKWGKIAGGLYKFKAEIAGHDFYALAPKTVMVVFPRTDDGAPVSTRHTETVNFTSLALAEYPTGFVGYDGTMSLQTSCTAVYVSAAQSNGAETSALATQMATDWYRWRLGRHHTLLQCIRPYDLEGFHDVLWTERIDENMEADQVSTYLFRAETINDLIQEYHHYGTGGYLVECCDGVWSNGETTIINNLQQFTQSEVTWNTDQDNFALDVNTSWLNVTTDGKELTGIVPPTDGNKLILVTVDPDSTGPLKIINESGDSTATNQIITTTGQDQYFQPGDTFQMIYDTTEDRWRIIPGDKPKDQPYTFAELTASVNNLDPAGAQIVDVTQDASGPYNITGLVAGVPGQRLTLQNKDTLSVNLIHESGSSTAANRIDTVTGTDAIIAPGGKIDLVYNGSTSRWEIITTTGVTYAPKSVTITASQDDYDTSGAFYNGEGKVVINSSDGAYNFTGFAGGYPGASLWIYNNTANTMTLKEEVTSATANQIITGTGDLAIAQDKSVKLVWSAQFGKWVVDSGTAYADDAAASAGGGSATPPTTVAATSIPQWFLARTYTFSDLTDADTSQDLTTYTVPAGYRIHESSFVTATAGVASGLVSLTLKLLFDGNLIGVGDCNGAVANSTGRWESENSSAQPLLWATTFTVEVRFDSSGANLDTLTAGEWYHFLLISRLK